MKYYSESNLRRSVMTGYLNADARAFIYVTRKKRKEAGARQCNLLREAHRRGGTLKGALPSLDQDVHGRKRARDLSQAVPKLTMGAIQSQSEMLEKTKR